MSRFESARATAAAFAAQTGDAHDLVPCFGDDFTVVGSFLATELYPGRSVYRVFPNGHGGRLEPRHA